MNATDREPQYLGTHRGISRVQVGWSTLYFNGDSYTHTIGNLYGTHEEPNREELTAARKVIPLKPRPPIMASTPGEEHKPSRKQEAHAEKPSAEKEHAARPAPAPPAKPSATPKPAKPAKEPPKEKPAKKPPKEKPAKPSPKATTKAPVSTMGELLKSVGEGTPGTQANPIGSIEEAERS